MEWILIRYGEIGLKSDWVRKSFEDRLMENIRQGFSSEGVEGDVERGYGRIFVNTEDIEGASEVLSRTFGVVSYSPCEKIETDVDRIVERMGDISEEHIDKEDTFSVRARRTGNHYFSSKDIEEKGGSEVIERTGAEVDLDDPDRTVYCEVRQNDSYIFKEKFEGPGGLPVGTQGRVLVMFKGDCNSFMSAWFMMRRGCSVTLLHGDPEPYSDINIDEIYQELEKWSHGSDLQSVEFDLGDVLFKIQESEYEDITCLLCRRFITKLGERVAEGNGCEATVSGESGESDFENFMYVDEVSKMPVLRPLVGMSRNEIASKCDNTADIDIGTPDCMAENRTSDVSMDRVHRADEDLDFGGMVKDVLDGLEDNL